MQNESEQKNIQAKLINDSQPKKKKKRKKKKKLSWSNNNYKIGLKKITKVELSQGKKKKKKLNPIFLTLFIGVENLKCNLCTL